jgi:hypothetical protein
MTNPVDLPKMGAGYEPDEIEKWAAGLPPEALMAGEDVLRASDPERFDYGQAYGWHDCLIKAVLVAVIRASPSTPHKLPGR